MTATTQHPAPATAGAHIAPGADVDERATLGPGARVWHMAQIREDAVVGADCVIGRGAYIGPGVQVGDRCKIQNHALVYEPAVLEDGVFIGPGVVLTNDHLPRAVNPDGSLKTGDDWHAVGVTVRAGAAVGARAVCVAPVVIGRWAMVAAGAVVTRDVPDFALVAGVPARWVRWIGRTGEALVSDDAVPDDAVFDEGPAGGADRRWRCPDTADAFVEQDGVLVEATEARS
ncbi:acyltransferase [Cellulomonas cellasea]|uniref:acyltransferase n=1 Tax=Cellulomonas cellasea TaxID=43670 RepID=UPI0025A3DCFD|nr:acyltransferase [Cellulomonas cellasea]MDM8083241.1 acyltransferase [Cellulomonas cellasea]